MALYINEVEMSIPNKDLENGFMSGMNRLFLFRAKEAAFIVLWP